MVIENYNAYNMKLIQKTLKLRFLLEFVKCDNKNLMINLYIK